MHFHLNVNMDPRRGGRPVLKQLDQVLPQLLQFTKTPQWLLAGARSRHYLSQGQESFQGKSLAGHGNSRMSS